MVHIGNDLSLKPRLALPHFPHSKNICSVVNSSVYRNHVPCPEVAKPGCTLQSSRVLSNTLSPSETRVQLILVVAWARGLFITPWVVLLLITDKGKFSHCPTGWILGRLTGPPDILGSTSVNLRGHYWDSCRNHFPFPRRKSIAPL